MNQDSAPVVEPRMKTRFEGKRHPVLELKDPGYELRKNTAEPSMKLLFVRNRRSGDQVEEARVPSVRGPAPSFTDLVEESSPYPEQESPAVDALATPGKKVPAVTDTGIPNQDEVNVDEEKTFNASAIRVQGPGMEVTGSVLISASLKATLEQPLIRKSEAASGEALVPSASGPTSPSTRTGASTPLPSYRVPVAPTSDLAVQLPKLQPAARAASPRAHTRRNRRDSADDRDRYQSDESEDDAAHAPRDGDESSENSDSSHARNAVRSTRATRSTRNAGNKNWNLRPRRASVVSATAERQPQSRSRRGSIVSLTDASQAFAGQKRKSVHRDHLRSVDRNAVDSGAENSSAADGEDEKDPLRVLLRAALLVHSASLVASLAEPKKRQERMAAGAALLEATGASDADRSGAVSPVQARKKRAAGAKSSAVSAELIAMSSAFIPVTPRKRTSGGAGATSSGKRAASSYRAESAHAAQSQQALPSWNVPASSVGAAGAPVLVVPCSCADCMSTAQGAGVNPDAFGMMNSYMSAEQQQLQQQQAMQMQQMQDQQQQAQQQEAMTQYIVQQLYSIAQQQQQQQQQQQPPMTPLSDAIRKASGKPDTARGRGRPRLTSDAAAAAAAAVAAIDVGPVQPPVPTPAKKPGVRQRRSSMASSVLPLSAVAWQMSLNAAASAAAASTSAALSLTPIMSTPVPMGGAAPLLPSMQQTFPQQMLPSQTAMSLVSAATAGSVKTPVTGLAAPTEFESRKPRTLFLSAEAAAAVRTPTSTLPAPSTLAGTAPAAPAVPARLSPIKSLGKDLSAPALSVTPPQPLQRQAPQQQQQPSSGSLVLPAMRTSAPTSAPTSPLTPITAQLSRTAQSSPLPLQAMQARLTGTSPAVAASSGTPVQIKLAAPTAAAACDSGSEMYTDSEDGAPAGQASAGKTDQQQQPLTTQQQAIALVPWLQIRARLPPVARQSLHLWLLQNAETVNTNRPDLAYLERLTGMEKRQLRGWINHARRRFATVLGVASALPAAHRTLQSYLEEQEKKAPTSPADSVTSGSNARPVIAAVSDAVVAQLAGQTGMLPALVSSYMAEAQSLRQTAFTKPAPSRGYVSRVCAEESTHRSASAPAAALLISPSVSASASGAATASSTAASSAAPSGRSSPVAGSASAPNRSRSSSMLRAAGIGGRSWWWAQAQAPAPVAGGSGTTNPDSAVSAKAPASESVAK